MSSIRRFAASTIWSLNPFRKKPRKQHPPKVSSRVHPPKRVVSRNLVCLVSPLAVNLLDYSLHPLRQVQLGCLDLRAVGVGCLEQRVKEEDYLVSLVRAVVLPKEDYLVSLVQAVVVPKEDYLELQVNLKLDYSPHLVVNLKADYSVSLVQAVVVPKEDYSEPRVSLQVVCSVNLPLVREAYLERQVNPLDNLKAARAGYLVNLKVVRAGCLVSLKARVHPPGCSVNLQAVLARLKVVVASSNQVILIVVVVSSRVHRKAVLAIVQEAPPPAQKYATKYSAV